MASDSASSNTGSGAAPVVRIDGAFSWLDGPAEPSASPRPQATDVGPAGAAPNQAPRDELSEADLELARPEPSPGYLACRAELESAAPDSAPAIELCLADLELVDADPSPVIEFAVADLEPDEADLALQDLLADPEGRMFDAANSHMAVQRFLAELLGQEEDEDGSDDPTVKIRVPQSSDDIDVDAWCNGAFGLGDVVAVTRHLGFADRAGEAYADRPSGSDLLEAAWFTTTLPTNPPPPPTSHRRRAVGAIAASAVMSAAIVLGMVQYAPPSGEPVATARVGLATMLEPGPTGSLESLATEGAIDATCDEPPMTCTAPAVSTPLGTETAIDAESAAQPALELQQSVPPADVASPRTEASSETPDTAGAESLSVADLERMAMAQLEAAELEAAAATAELWTTIAPTDARAYLCLGAALLDLGRIAEAHEAFRSCVRQAEGSDVSDCMAFVGRP